MDQRLLNKQWRVEHLYKIKTKDATTSQFKKNSAQEHFSAIAHTRNLILKSRQLGFTTFEAIDALDDTLFKRNYNSLIISHLKDSSLDIFDNKVDYAWKNFPEELRGLYRVRTDTKNQLTFDFGDGTSSSISVRSSGRSGTYNRVHISEFAKMCLLFPHRAEEIITGTIPAVPLGGRVDIESTAEGNEGSFYEMFMEAWGKEPEYETQYKAHFYNWTWDKDEIAKVQPIAQLPKEFLEHQALHSLGEQETSYYFLKWISLNKNWARLKQEYPTTPEEAFAGALEGTYYTDYVSLAQREKRIGHFPHMPELPVYTVWDRGYNDENVIVFFQIKDNEVRIIDCYHNNGYPMPHYFEILDSKPYQWAEHFLPWDANSTDYTNGKSAFELMSARFKNVRIVPNIRVIDGINAVRDVFHRLTINENPCDTFLKAVKRYRKAWDDKNGVWKDKPEHDWTSHFADTLRYLALSIREVRKQTKPLSYSTAPGTSHIRSSDFAEEFETRSESLFTY